MDIPIFVCAYKYIRKKKGKKREDKIDIASYRNARVVAVARTQSASSDLSMVIDARFV